MLSPRTAPIAVVLLLTALSLPTALRAQFTPPGTNPSLRDHQPGFPSMGNGDDRMPTTMTGSVRTTDNRAISNARVEVRDLSNGSAVATAYTNAAGNFEFHDLQRGSYEIVVTHGMVESRERVDFRITDFHLNIRLMDPNVVAENAGGTTVSVANLKVPGKAKSAYHKAEELVQKGRIDDARKELQKALDAYPTYGAAYTLLGIISLDQQDSNAALANLDKAIHYDPNTAMPYLVQGAAFNSMQRFDDALRSLTSGLHLAPQMWQAYFEMAKAYLGKGEFPNALQQVRKAEELGGQQYAPVHLVKAHALVGAKEYNKAAAELELYISRDPQSAGASAARQELNQVKAFAASQ